MRTTLWCCLLSMVLATCVSAQQADVLQPYRLSQFAADARLRQPVTFTALSTPLSEALQRLSEQTGVRLRAGRGVGQWRLVARVQALPLADLLAAIACVFDLSWRVVPGEEGQPPAYELYQSPAQAQRVRAEFEARVRMLQRILPQAFAEAQRRLQSGDTAIDTVSAPRSERDLVLLYAHSLIAQPMLRAAVSVLDAQAIARLLAGEDLMIRGDQLPAAQQRLLLELPSALSAHQPPVQGTVSLLRWRYDPFGSQLNVSVHVRRGESGGGFTGGGLPLPPAPSGGRYAFHDTTDLRSLMSSDELRRTLPQEGTLPSHLTVPELLHRLSVMGAVHVVAEYYPLSMPLWYPSGAGRNVQEVLQILLQRNFYQPQRTGNMLLFSAKNRYERRLCDVPAASLHRWLNEDGWFGLRVASLREIAQLTPIQQRALGWWANAEAHRFGAEGDYRAVVYDTLSSLTVAEGTAVGIWRLLMALPPAAQWRALSGRQVVLNDFVPVVKLPVEELIPPLFPIDMAQALSSQRVWVQTKRTVTRHWVCPKPRSERVRNLNDLWMSQPGESLEAFRRRLQEREGVQHARFMLVEMETVTLRLGTGNRAISESAIRLPRFLHDSVRR